MRPLPSWNLVVGGPNLATASETGWPTSPLPSAVSVVRVQAVRPIITHRMTNQAIPIPKGKITLPNPQKENQGNVSLGRISTTPDKERPRHGRPGPVGLGLGN